MIRLENVSFGYDEREVLHGLSLSVGRSDFIALIGPNGSGKSTKIKLMTGLLTPAEGTIYLDGDDLHTLSPKRRGARIAYFPQSRPVPNMDVLTLVSHGRFPRLDFGRVMGNADREAVQRALSQTGLEGMTTRSLSGLSGGERQRAYLAMLIAQDAEVLLLDEPGAFLDIRHQLEVMEILKALNFGGKTIVFAAHDLPLAFSCAKRILLLENGELTGDAPPGQMAETGLVERAFGVRIRRQEDDSLFKYTLAGIPPPEHSGG